MALSKTANNQDEVDGKLGIRMNQRNTRLQESLQCPFESCNGMEFARSSGTELWRHLELVHEIYPDEYECEKCGIRFYSQKTLYNHLNSRLSHPPNRCEYCRQSFDGDDWEKELRSHNEKRHSPERLPFYYGKCKLCSKQVLWLRLEMHIHRHLKQRHIPLNSKSAINEVGGSLMKHEIANIDNLVEEKKVEKTKRFTRSIQSPDIQVKEEPQDSQEREERKTSFAPAIIRRSQSPVLSNGSKKPKLDESMGDLCDRFQINNSEMEKSSLENVLNWSIPSQNFTTGGQCETPNPSHVLPTPASLTASAPAPSHVIIIVQSNNLNHSLASNNESFSCQYILPMNECQHRFINGELYYEWTLPNV